MLIRGSCVIGVAGAALAALTAAGCVHEPLAGPATARATSAAPAAGTGTARLVVQNQNFADMKVYAARSGSVAARLGMATGLSTTTFAIPPSLFYDGTLELVVRPIGGTSVTGSGQLLVSSGQTITFTIQPLLPASMATVR
jgi:hypothetical protein